MAESDSLLAFLVPRLTGRVEDTATDALAFILNKSANCRSALGVILGDAGLQPIHRVRTQVTYEDGSRPDMIGYDQSGAKRLIVESKFWASLLKDQASGYFGQLEQEGPGVLLFVAPEIRLDSLWAAIKRQMECGERSVHLEAVETAGPLRSARVTDSDKRLMLVSWPHLLTSLEAAANDASVESDIRQLIGLARRQDGEAFPPIHTGEFGLSLPRRIRGLNRLIDDTVDAHGVPEGWMDITKSRATPQKEGYGRYFQFAGVAGYLFLCVEYSLWATRADTPLWLRIGSEVPVSTDRIRDRVPSSADGVGQDYYAFDVPINLKTGVEYQEVLCDVVRQVREIKEKCLTHSNV